MRKPKRIQKRRRKSFLARPLFLGVAVAAVLLAAGGFSFAATQESHDSFCASCHTQPESTYYQRSLGAQPVDLASAHEDQQQARCIDCHSGSGLFGRVGAELLGARNAVAWYTHTATQPAPLTAPIGDGNCLKCHQQVITQTPDLNNHFHVFLTRWQAADPHAGGCVSCHSSHTTGATADTTYMAEAPVSQVCGACHSVLGGGG